VSSRSQLIGQVIVGPLVVSSRSDIEHETLSFNADRHIYDLLNNIPMKLYSVLELRYSQVHLKSAPFWHQKGKIEADIIGLADGRLVY
jgi:hypothetical protein